MYDYHAIYWFIGSCIFVRSMYYVIDAKLKKSVAIYSSLPVFRQMYIQKNFIKSIYLALLTVYATIKVIWPIASQNKWNSYAIHRLAALYVSNDFTGLVCVDKLPQTTKIHHIVTTILVFVALGINFQTSDIGQAMLVYTMASSAAYVVNLHLALRWLAARNSLVWLRYIAGSVYVSTCTISWSWHIWWAFTRAHFNIGHVFYFLLLGWIVRDDIILMQWLTREHK